MNKSCLFVRGARPTVWGKIYRQPAIIGCIIETENERKRIREPILASDLFDLRERLSKLPMLFKYDFLVDILLGFFYFIRINLPFPTHWKWKHISFPFFIPVWDRTWDNWPGKKPTGNFCAKLQTRKCHISPPELKRGRRMPSERYLFSIHRQLFRHTHESRKSYHTYSCKCLSQSTKRGTNRRARRRDIII